VIPEDTHHFEACQQLAVDSAVAAFFERHLVAGGARPAAGAAPRR
jgi:hypothetical protein